MVISETVIIVMFILLSASIIGNAVLIGLYVADQNTRRQEGYTRKEQEFNEQKERVDKRLHESRR